MADSFGITKNSVEGRDNRNDAAKAEGDDEPVGRMRSDTITTDKDGNEIGRTKGEWQPLRIKRISREEF